MKRTIFSWKDLYQSRLPQTGPTNMEAMKGIINRRVALKLFSIFELVNTWLPNPCWYRWYRWRRRRFSLILSSKFTLLGFDLRKKFDWKNKRESSNLVLPLCLLRVYAANHFLPLLMILLGFCLEFCEEDDWVSANWVTGLGFKPTQIIYLFCINTLCLFKNYSKLLVFLNGTESKLIRDHIQRSVILNGTESIKPNLSNQTLCFLV